MADNDYRSAPGTEPFVPDFDTGAHSQRFLSLAGQQDRAGKSWPGSTPKPQEDPVGVAPSASVEVLGSEPAATLAHSVTVPGRYTYLKWWKFVLVVLGVWIGAGEVGLSLFYWWYHTLDKTAAVFVVLVYVVACTVGGLILALVPGRPLITALSSGDVGAVCLGRRRGAALRLLLLRADESLPGRRHSVLVGCRT